jgi:hypothetical protein
MEPPQTTELAKLVLRLVNPELLAEVADTRCTVCMGHFRVREEVLLTGCRHIFHHRCISQWFADVCSTEFELPQL